MHGGKQGMSQRQNLHFLLALGNTKMVVLKEKDRLQIYTNPSNKPTIKSSRIAEALSSR